MKKLLILLAVIFTATTLSYGFTSRTLTNNGNPNNKYRSYYVRQNVSNVFMNLYVKRGGTVDNTMKFVQAGLYVVGNGFEGGFLGEMVGASQHGSENYDRRYIYIAPPGQAYWLNIILDCPLYKDYAEVTLTW
jgi:hypothetical protein